MYIECMLVSGWKKPKYCHLAEGMCALLFQIEKEQAVAQQHYIVQKLSVYSCHEGSPRDLQKWLRICVRLLNMNVCYRLRRKRRKLRSVPLCRRRRWSQCRSHGLVMLPCLRSATGQASLSLSAPFRCSHLALPLLFLPWRQQRTGPCLPRMTGLLHQLPLVPMNGEVLPTTLGARCGILALFCKLSGLYDWCITRQTRDEHKQQVYIV